MKHCRDSCTISNWFTAVGEDCDVALLISSGDAVKVDGGRALVVGVDGSGGCNIGAAVDAG